MIDKKPPDLPDIEDLEDDFDIAPMDQPELEAGQTDELPVPEVGGRQQTINSDD